MFLLLQLSLLIWLKIYDRFIHPKISEYWLWLTRIASSKNAEKDCRKTSRPYVLIINLIQLSLNSGSAQIQILLGVFGDSKWWGSLSTVPTGDKAKHLLLVNHTTKTIYHHRTTLWLILKFPKLRFFKME